jgi:PAS domain S-box-containing protein
VEVFVSQIEDMRSRLAMLEQKTNELPFMPKNLLEEGFEALCTTLEEIQVAQQELLQQKEELLANREAVEERIAGLICANEQLRNEIAQRRQKEEDLKLAKQELEIQVEEQTAQLKAVKEQLLKEIAERKKTNDELEQSLSLLQGTLEATADGIVITKNGTDIVNVNQKFCNMWGIPEAVIALRDLNLVVPFILEQLKDPDAFLEQTKDLLSQPNVEGYGIFELKDGRVIERYSFPQYLGGKIVGRVCSCRDITERQKAQVELQQSEQKYKNLFHNSLVGMFRTTLTDGTILDANAALVKMFGGDSFEGFKAVDFYANPADREVLKKLLIETGFVENFEVQLRRLDNSIIWVSYSGKLYIKEGYLEGVMIDITKRKLAEEALREANEHLEVKVQARTAQLRQAIANFQELALREALLNRLATEIRNSLDLDTILETAVQEIYNRLNIDVCAFAWYEKDAPSPGWNIIQEAKNSDLPSFLGLYPLESWRPFTCKLVEREELQTDNAFSREGSRKQRLMPYGTTALLSLPIEAQSGQLGMLTCGRLLYRQSWTDEELELLQAVANQLAIGINQAQLYEQSRIAATIAQSKATQLEIALRKLQETQAKLVQSEKMSSLGQLVAGVAHEINNPLNFIHGNLTHVNEYAIDLLNLIQVYQRYYTKPAPEIQAEIERIELDFIKTDLPKLLQSMSLGADRICQIVLSLRNFSRLDESEMKRVNIHEGIDNTLLILAHRLKDKPTHSAIQIIKEYGDLPKIQCYPGQLNQVFMNILSNGIDALEESVVRENITEKQLIIHIRTEVKDSQNILIWIADNGTGIDLEVQRKIFDPFFTTKPVGQGTGLGLSISYQIVVEKHGGQLQCISAPGQGTEFLITLPMEQQTSTSLHHKQLEELLPIAQLITYEVVE